MQNTKLILLIRDKGIKRSYLANYLEITDASLRNKLNGKTEFKVSEIEKIGHFLNLSTAELSDIFLSKSI